MMFCYAYPYDTINVQYAFSCHKKQGKYFDKEVIVLLLADIRHPINWFEYIHTKGMQLPYKIQ